MTLEREEAIGNLEYAKRWKDRPTDETIDMAIKALKQEPCEDTISRQEVLDGIADLKKSPWFNDDTNGAKFIRKEAVEIIEDLCIKSLPPVTPQPKIGHWIIVDYEKFVAKCSECGQIKDSRMVSNCSYCPDCGAKMEEVNADADSD